MSPDEFSQFCDERRQAVALMSLDELTDRRAQLSARSKQLAGFAHRSAPQETEFDDANAEVVVLDELIGERRTIERSAKIAAGVRAMSDPRNLERPDAAVPGQRGAPALVKGLGDRRETADEVIQRAGNPWRDEGGPLAGHTSYGRGETGQGLISRAHSALEALEDTLTRDGCEKLAQAMSEETSWPGAMIKRSKEEQAQAAELWLALSSPFYAQALRSALKWPVEFTAGGTGFESLSDEERQAWRDVRTNSLCRAAFSEASGAAGAFAISLDLHPDIILTNAGSANPFKQLARTVVATTNVAEFVTSAGSTANWLPEGQAVADTTPTIGQLAVTHYKEAVWIYGSFEVLQDSALGSQVPALVADAKDRLEVVAFTSGSGSAQPFGLITHGTSDATVGAISAATVYGLHNSLPPRFRVGDGARPVWLANVAIMNALRQVPAFTGAVNPILNDSTPDGIPELAGVDVYEDSAMVATQTTGSKNLALVDMNSFIVTRRQPELLLYEPLFKDQATGRPSGQAGWFSWSRTGSDLTTATACQFHTA